MAENLSRFVYDELRQRILDGRLPAGESISEREIGSELDVSRVPIREALPLLAAAGLVTLSPRRPAVVTPVTRSGVDELYDIRAVLEPFVARQAAARVAAGADASPLRNTLALAAAAVQRNDLDGFHCHSGEVHMEIERLSGSALFVEVMAPLHERSDRLNVANIHTDPAQRHNEHEALVDAIAGGRPDLASAVAFAHVEWGRTRTLHTLEEVPGYAPDL